MSNIAVIYWSQTGNTEMMANAIAEGIREAGAECDVLSVPAVSADQAAEYEKLALGCPAMGPSSPSWSAASAAARWPCSVPTAGATVSGCGTGCSAPRMPTPTSIRIRA